MDNPWIVVAAILAVAVTFVLVPVVTDAFRRYRKSKILLCPEVGKEAEVGIDVHRAAFTSAFGRPLLRVKNCSLWPERKDCGQDCLTSEGASPPEGRPSPLNVGVARTESDCADARLDESGG